MRWSPVGWRMTGVAIWVVLFLAAFGWGDATGSAGLQFGTEPLLIQSWGGEGSEPGQFRFPEGIAVHDSRLFVADTGNHRIQAFSTSGRFLHVAGRLGSGDGQLNAPEGVTVAPGDRVIVSDSGNKRLQAFGWNGNHLAGWGDEAEPPEGWVLPVGVTLDGAGNLLVADAFAHRIQRVSVAGEFEGGWGEGGAAEGKLDHPADVAVDGQGNVYVADNNNHRVQKFSPDGQFLSSWGGLCRLDTGEGCVVPEGPGVREAGDGQFFTPFAIAIDEHDRVYVVDQGNDRIQVFDSSGRFLRKWGETGSGPGQFRFPKGIAVAGGSVWVVDSDNHRVQAFSLFQP